MTVYVTTIVAFQTGKPEVTRVAIGCIEPAREFFDTMCHAMQDKGVVSFRMMDEIPERGPEEKLRAEAMLQLVFGRKQLQ